MTAKHRLTPQQVEALDFILERDEVRVRRGQVGEWQIYDGRLTRSFPRLIRLGLLEGEREAVSVRVRHGVRRNEYVWRVRLTNAGRQAAMDIVDR